MNLSQYTRNQFIKRLESSDQQQQQKTQIFYLLWCQIGTFERRAFLKFCLGKKDFLLNQNHLLFFWWWTDEPCVDVYTQHYKPAARGVEE